jgi:ATP-dependent Lon protease
MRDFRDAKTMAQTLRESLSTKAVTISHSESLEFVSKMFGVADWNTLSAMLKADRPAADAPAVPGQGTAVYPAIPMRDLVPFPAAVVPLFIGRRKTMQALERAFERQREVVLAVQKDFATDDPTVDDIHEMGALATLLEVQRLPDDTMKALVQINRRVAIRRFIGETGTYQAEIADLNEGPIADAPELVQRAVARFKSYATGRDIRVTTWPGFDGIGDPGRLADLISQHMSLPLRDKQSLLEILDPVARLERVDALMAEAPVRAAELGATLQRALGCAAVRRHRHATLEHMLLALADDKDAAAVMRGCGVDLGELRESLVRYLDTGLTDLVVVEGEAQPTPTRGFQRMMQRADAHAKEAGQREVTGANCIVGLFDEWRSPATQRLAEQKMARQAALDFIAVTPPGKAQ